MNDISVKEILNREDSDQLPVDKQLILTAAKLNYKKVLTVVKTNFKPVLCNMKRFYYKKKFFSSIQTIFLMVV